MTRLSVRPSSKSGVSFDRLCELSGLPKPVAEFRFASHRNWRFDWAWPMAESGIALEVEGGIFVQGRHSRGAGMLRDMEKYNEAAALGWRVLRVTPANVESTATLDLLRRCLR